MKVALYARVSTVDKGQDPELQLKPMRQYCASMKWEYEEFVDHRSGANSNRDALNTILKRLRRKEFDILMVWKLDRLARSLHQLIDIVFGELQPRNIDFICLTQQMDTTTPTGKLLFGILGSLAEFEHDLLSERVREGIANAREKGITVGRKRVLGQGDEDKARLKRLLDTYQSTGVIREAARAAGLEAGTALGYLKREKVYKKPVEKGMEIIEAVK